MSLKNELTAEGVQHQSTFHPTPQTVAGMLLLVFFVNICVRNGPLLWLWEVYAKQRLGKREALPFISKVIYQQEHFSRTELSLFWDKGDSPLSRETLAPESLIFILEIIKTSILSKRLLYRQLSPVPQIANLKYLSAGHLGASAEVSQGLEMFRHQAALGVIFLSKYCICLLPDKVAVR